VTETTTMDQINIKFYIINAQEQLCIYAQAMSFFFCIETSGVFHFSQVAPLLPETFFMSVRKCDQQV
jgi:hypothetical protein